MNHPLQITWADSYRGVEDRWTRSHHTHWKRERFLLINHNMSPSTPERSSGAMREVLMVVPDGRLDGCPWPQVRAGVGVCGPGRPRYASVAGRRRALHASTFPFLLTQEKITLSGAFSQWKGEERMECVSMSHRT
ncbi:hypothetical protein J6590_060042 [Homalodisca vitripennis]|nr:hypothetical protein J6590_060042 [Homalodisca vitripennis]